MPKPNAEELFGAKPPLPNAEDLFRTSPKPAPKAAPRVAPKPAPQPSLWNRAVTDVENTATGAWKGITNAWEQAPARRAQGRAEVAQTWTGPNRAKMLNERGRHAVDTVHQAVAQVGRDFTTPLDKSKGWGALPARAGKLGLDAVGAVFAPASAIATAAAGPEVQALTGLHKDTFGDLASAMIPGSLAGEAAGAARRVGSVARAASKDGLKGASRDILGQRVGASMERSLKGPTVAGKAAQAAGRVYTGVRGAFDPSRASSAARATALSIRKFTGLNRAASDAAATKVGRLAKRFRADRSEDHTAFYNAVENYDKHEGTSTPGAAAKGEVFTGAERDLAREHGMNTDDLKALRVIRGAYKEAAERIAPIIKANVGSLPGLVKNYYHHIWQESEEEVEKRMASSGWNGFSRQGNSGFTKKRKYPTIADGVKAGLTPKYDPVQTTQIYLENLGRIAATHETQAFLKDNGHARWYRPGEAPEGWQPLQGAMTERVPKITGGGRPRKPGEAPGPPPPLQIGGAGQPRLGQGPGQPRLERPEYRVHQDPQLEGGVGGVPGFPQRTLGAGAAGPQLEDAAAKARNVTPKDLAEKKAADTGTGDRRVNKEVLYAPPEVARVYNNHVSKPFDPSKGPLEKAGHYAYKLGVNDMIWKMGLSPYHAITTAVESAVSSVAGGVQGLSRGQVKQGLKRIAQAPAAPLIQFDRGNTVRKQILKGAVQTPFNERVNKAIMGAGAKLTMDRDYRGTAAKTFYDSLKDGTFKREFKRNLMAVAKGDGSTQVKSRLFAAGDMAANMLSSVSAPLFQSIIPRIKLGAVAHMIEDYMTARPNATEREIEEYSARALDTVDNRFGELNRDNMFWNRKVQQVLQASLLSPTFKLGSGREMLGGVHDLPESIRGIKSGEGISPRTAYLIALPAVTGLTGAIYTYLKTGQHPDSITDLQGYRTGGTVPKSDQPERAVLPGNQKEVETWLNFTQPNSSGVTGYARNALGDPAGMAVDWAMNEDFKHQAIRGDGAPDGATATWLEDRAMPIQYETMTTPRKQGSNITTTDQLMLGMRPAPPYIQDLEGANRKAEKRMALQKKIANRSNAKYKNSLEDTSKPASDPALPSAEELFSTKASAATLPSADDLFKDTTAPLKPGAANAGSIRPEFNPVVDFISRLPGVQQITAENDSFHPASDVHGQGRAMDFTIKGGRETAADFARNLRARLSAEGFTRVKVLDEYNHPSRNATGGHIHVQYS